MCQWTRALFTTVSKQKNEFLHKYVKMDEAWIHHFTPESNQQSAEWTVVGESHSKQPEMQRSAGKVLASIFWDVQGISFIDYLEKGRTINSEYYVALFVCLKEEITKKKPGHKWRRKKCSFTKTMYCVTSWLQWWQNYMNCTSNYFCTHPILHIWSPVTTGCLQTSKECSRERDLAPMKKWYQKLRCILRSKTTRSTKKGMELLEKHWNQCISLEGDYVDE